MVFRSASFAISSAVLCGGWGAAAAFGSLVEADKALRPTYKGPSKKKIKYEYSIGVSLFAGYTDGKK